jgi:hypothetical protein
MILSIHEIITGLLSGAYTREQAGAWLEQHMQLSAAMGEPASNEYPPLGLAVPSDGDNVTWNFPILHFGYGAIEVGDAAWNGLPALFFGTDGQGLGHERERNEPAADKETLLLFTFKNLAGIEALEQATARVRAKMEAEGQAA